MGTLPVVNTPIIITKAEVYITNQTGGTEQVRDFAAFSDLGEDTTHTNPLLTNYNGNATTLCQPNLQYVIVDSTGAFPHNGANSLYGILTNTQFPVMPPRTSTDASAIFSALSTNTIPNTCNDASKFMQSTRDFEVVRNGRKLNPTEFTINNRLGFISINQSINNDVTVAVAYQYTYNGKVYQVGEFSDQYTTGPLYLKLLKSGSVTNPRFSNWDLMMKNVYSLGAYNLNPADFKCDIYYNNIETGVDIPYIPSGSVNGKLLVQLMDLDKLSVNGDRYPDGVFDFIKDYTINPNNGRIYLSSKEPFGNNLKDKFTGGDFPNANKYIYQELYDSTRTIAQQLPEKNRYKIKGSFKSSGGSEISLNALNIPQGAVAVTANGQPLTENVDYTVDYTLGRVKIINESILNSGANIKVSTESNSLFNVQQKSLFGTRLDFKVNKDLIIGGTLLRLNEKPVTQKVNIGDEPVSNTIWGLDYNYKTDAPFLTRLIDKIPLINTKEMSSITTQGEFAQLIPGNAKAIGKSGNSYIDDFEGSISLIDIKSPSAWSLASIPQGQPSLFPEASLSDDIRAGMNRAQFNWYAIDPLFYGQQNTNLKPGNITEPIFSNNFMRQVLETELFPSKTPANGQPVVLPVLDLAFYPSERGPYNYDFDPAPGGYSNGIIKTGNQADIGKLQNPSSRWGGIMRRLETNDFQSANIEYIQFWMMDPFNSDYQNSTYKDMDANSPPSGELYFNLGNISEDIVKDGKMLYENGLPSASNPNLTTVTSNVGRSPLISPIANSFVNAPADRPEQDVGYDGLDDAAEKVQFANFWSNIQGLNSSYPNSPYVQSVFNDLSSDKYHFFRGTDYDQLAGIDANTLSRYKKYNNPEGNSPTESQYPDAGIPSAATNNPNIEDINKDNTLSENENYYQYRVKISPQDIDPSKVGTNYIVNVTDGTATVGSTQKTVKWYQFKIPITEFESAYGSIEGFNSIRFMRMYMKGFDKPVVCRLARLELVRSDWRRYAYNLQKPGEYIANDDNTTTFDVSAVSLQENGAKTPVNYIIPPGINQQQNVQTTNLVLLNEQALNLRACNLKDGDSRAITKNVEIDARSFKKMKLFMHAEKLNNEPLNDGDVTVFVRLGSDFNNNFYEYEIPVKLTTPGYYDPNSESEKYNVWPEDNEFVIDFEKLAATKLDRNGNSPTGDLASFQKPYTREFGGYNITVVGNPNVASIKSVMIGIRNPKDRAALSKCVEVWVNELRLTDFENKGGWATTGRVQAKLADLGQVSVSATYSKPFFGSIEKKISERSRETNFQWDATSTFQLGKFFPNKWKINLPFYYAYGQTRITPQFSPYDPDIKIDNPNISKDLRDQIKANAQDVTVRKGYNFSNVRIDGFKKEGRKPMPWDVSNFSVTYAYNEITRRNVNTEVQFRITSL
jgi:cell surface protein SprA